MSERPAKIFAGRFNFMRDSPLSRVDVIELSRYLMTW